MIAATIDRRGHCAACPPCAGSHGGHCPRHRLAPIPPSFTTDYGPGHLDTDAGVFSADAAADLLAERIGDATVAVLHVHLANVEPLDVADDPYSTCSENLTPRSVGVELTLPDLRALSEAIIAAIVAAERS